MNKESDFERIFCEKTNECMQKLINFINETHFHPSVWSAALSEAVQLNLIQCGCGKKQMIEFHQGIIEQILAKPEEDFPAQLQETKKENAE